MFLIVDSNILMSHPQILQDKENEIVLITDVLKELDGLKKNENAETAFKARRAAIIISRNIGKIIFVNEYDKQKMTVDEKLLAAAQSILEHDEVCLITNDVYLKVQATLKHIPTKGYGGSEDYTGVKTIYITPDENGYHSELDSLLNENKLLAEQNSLRENEFLIVKDLTQPIRDRHGNEDFQTLYIGICKNGKINQIDTPKIFNSTLIESQQIGIIKPRNPEQKCLAYALNDPDITILYAGGGFGLGKTFMLNNYALSQLEKGKIKKIVYVPNNAFVANSMELGYLPGSSFEKLTPLIGSLVDLVGIDKINDMLQQEMLEIIPIGYMRGRNFDNSIILVSEAQNLDEEQVKLLIGRVGENSRILFDGSLKQVDSAIFKNKSGLKLLLTISNHPFYSKKFATVKLKTVERSDTAQIADYLDNLNGNL